MTAFSRADPAHKIYVQHRMKEKAAEINSLLEQKAYFYVCGDAANMAREVNEILAGIIAGKRGVRYFRGIFCCKNSSEKTRDLD